MEAHQLIADFMKSSTAVETYLHKGGKLTPLQEQSLGTTISMLETLFRSWQLKKEIHGN